ncbi:phage tail tape measure protein [Palleniella muris]|uniref:Phage tail tape measure protein n=1 Tax=Palleniella muris TaxID=3038145 RepID=A0AC61QR57_9BACT|nr:phage tail tape measure protein [Palleniella muris]TGX82786.1 phage tail tape measure protein [Palleniella muris]
MTGQTYQVNYIVNVDAANAQSAINSFKRAVASMDKATKPITDLQRKVRGLVETMSALNRGKYSVKIDTRPATQKIGKLIRALQMAKVEVQQLNAMGVTLGGVGNKKKTASRTAATAAPIGGSSSRTRTAPSRSSSTTTAATRRYATSVMRHPTNLGYKLWGPTPLPNNGGMAIDMLKGMGIAYGIAGAGMLVSEVVNQAAEYDNAMKTVENILKSHDTAENFAGRFAQMTQVVRNVGMKTKFKVTEVADAAKFLAMAGFNVNAIQQAISPIADIALVGDTELGKTADLVTNIMTAYNIEPNKMRNAADIMTNTFTMSNTTLTEIAEAYKYAASLLSAGEVSFEEATAAIGVLGDAGIKGSQAGTTMRTIMANLANPTKKQRAGWEDIGISLTDKNGQRKDILQIFQELHDKNLDVDAYYRIFHKTAASGAVALATHADKWEKVYLENFLAGGMTRRLAEEKQNTFQGLWAQLVSVFTDQGVTAFNGVQGALRGWMKMAINWMDPNKNPDAQKVFKEVANSLMEFIQILIDASKWFVWFFDKFGGLVKTWAKFQLMIWPVVKAVTALRSVFLGLLGLRKVGAVMVGLAGSFTKLGRAATVATAVMPYGAGAAAGSAPMSPFGFAAGMAGFAPLSYKQYIKASKGLNLSRPHASTSGYYLNRIDNLGREAEVAAWNSGVYQARQAEDAAALKRYKQNQKTFNKRVRNMQIRNGLKGFGKMGVGAAGMMLGMHQMTKENANGWDVASGGLFAAAGMAAMVGGPIGWIAAAGLALGGLGASLASFNQNLNALSGFVNDFSNSHQLLDGALLNGNTRTERYLEFVWRKNYDINDLIQRRIELMKELLGIETPNATTTKDVGNETYKTMYEKFYAADSMWGSRGAASRAADLFNKYGQEFGLSVRNYGGDWYYQDANGKYIRFANPKGSSDTNDAVMYDVAAAMELLHGQYRSKIMDENQHRLAQILYGKATVEDAKNWRDTFAATYGPASWATLIRPDQWNEDTDVAKYWSGEDIAKSYMGAQLLWKSMYQMVEAQNAIADFKEKLAAGNLTENDVVRALRWGDYDVLGQTLADYNPNDVTSWFRNMGYAGDGIWRDPSGRETPEVMAQTAAGQMQRLLESIQKLGLEADPSTQALQTYANTLLTLAQSFMGSNEALSGSHDGEIKELNGQKWRWNATTKQWELIDDNNQPAQISQGLVDMSNNMNTLLTTVQNVNSQWPTLFPTVYPINFGWGYNSASPYNWGTDNNNLTTNGLLWNPLTNTNNGQPFSWWPSWNNGNNLFTPQQMGNAVAKPNAPGVHTPTGNNHNEGTNNGGRTGTRTSDYKSHQKERAIPKQININIQNLMKVDSIDMTNENNVAIIEKLKEKVAYALYEAAADGTMMLNGLSNT